MVKHARIISRVFGVSCVVLLCAMCGIVAYEYANMLWANKYLLTSAPAWVAFLLAIPFTVAIGICFVLHLLFKRVSKSN